jgi:hypothetical protein
MAKTNHQRSTRRHRRGGGPKSRKPKNTTVKNDDALSVPASPQECAICQEPMTKPRDAKKTKCGHRFHKECLLNWCKQCEERQQGKTCPMCRQDIAKDCASLQPGQPMPENRIRDILWNEDAVALFGEERVSGSENEGRRNRMKAFLMKLRFPKRFDYFKWNEITSFRAACDAAINLEEVRAEFA